MPSKSSGRIEKPRRHKFSTPHSKNHRWESFSTKISKFNALQPLKKVRRHDLETEDLSATTSYLYSGLQRWNELNITRGFVSFKRELLPLAESLPQILHFEQRIFDIFHQHISLHDKEALEPLLDLLTAFAHDLGQRFEKYYLISLQVLVDVAKDAREPELLEWTFGAIAFLFKYLSKLIVSDLRPTYDVLSILLGKGRYPPHIARFAAEALSFLIRKSAVPAYCDTSLKVIIQHSLEDLVSWQDDRQFLLFRDGIMTMFAEAIKSTNTVHSTASTIFEYLIKATRLEEKSDPKLVVIWSDVVCGVMTSVIHHCYMDKFADLLNSILDTTEAILENCIHALPCVRLLAVVAGTRKGTRISAWSRLIKLQLQFLISATKRAGQSDGGSESQDWWLAVKNIAIAWQNAPTEELIPHIASLTNTLMREPLAEWFLPFCTYYSEIDTVRAGNFFKGDCQR